MECSTNRPQPAGGGLERASSTPLSWGFAWASSSMSRLTVDICGFMSTQYNQQQAIYTHGCVFATLIATQTPNARVNSSLSRLHFRGLPILILHRLVKISVIFQISTNGLSLLKLALQSLITDLLLSYLRVANVHAILNQHSGTFPYWRCLPTWSTWSKTFRAMSLYSINSSICFYLPVYLIRLAGALEGRLEASETVQFFCLLSTIVILYFGTVVPAYAIFIRVAASAQRSESLTIKGAWQGLRWSSRIQFFKLLGEVLIMEASVTIVIFVSVLALCHPDLHDGVFQFFVKYFG